MNVCMSLLITRNGNSWSFLNMSCADDDYPNIVPLTIAPNVAAMIMTTMGAQRGGKTGHLPHPGKN
jgi:hypothetical protein